MRSGKMTPSARQRELKRLGKLPLGCDNFGWHKHYAEVFNKNHRDTAAHLAMWYLLAHLAFKEEQ